MTTKQLSALSLACALLIGLLIGVNSITSAPSRDHAPSQSRALIPSAPASTTNPVPAGTKPKALRDDAFEARFGLQSVERHMLYRQSLNWTFDLLEQRGEATTVVEHKGNRLVLRVPPLSSAALADWVAGLEAKMAPVVGPARAAAISRAPDGVATLLSWVGAEMLTGETTYTFDRLTDEIPGSQPILTEPPHLHVLMRHTKGDQTNEMLVPNFTWQNAITIGLASQSMAKAPTGYFRSEPIIGSSARPAPTIVVYEDPNSDQVQVLNATGVGSIDVVDVNTLRTGKR